MYIYIYIYIYIYRQITETTYLCSIPCQGGHRLRALQPGEGPPHRGGLRGRNSKRQEQILNITNTHII